MKPLKVLALLLALSLLCSCTPIVIPSDQPTESTGEDIFTPTQQPTEAPGPDAPTDSSALPSETDPISDMTGSASWGITSYDIDAVGAYVIYHGEEMTLQMNLKHSGRAGKYGTGLLLFVDGQPQPYKTDEEDFYSYMHTFYHRNSNKEFTVSFIPVTGKEGDALELCGTLVDSAYYDPAKGIGSCMPGMVSVSIRMAYAATPPAGTDLCQPSVMLSDVQIYKTETKATDVAGWSAVDLFKRIGTRFLVDGQSYPMTRYEMSKEQPVSLEFNLWGTTTVKYGLVLFIDHQPVVAEDGKPFMLDIESGQTSVFRATLDMTGFEDKRTVYAILVPRNICTAAGMVTEVVLTSTSCYTLLSKQAVEHPA